MQESYNGFGPIGPANTDVTEGVNYAALYEHAPDCNCYGCNGQEGADEAYEAEIAQDMQETGYHECEDKE